MRIKEKEIVDRNEIESIMKKEKVLHIAMSDGDTPYVLAMTYGYDNGLVYIHTSREGRKLDILRKNNKVCFIVDTDHQLIKSSDKNIACKSGINFRSVIGNGRAHIIDDPQEKRKAVDVIMRQAFDETDFKYADESVNGMLILKVEIDSITGKKSGY